MQDQPHAASGPPPAATPPASTPRGQCDPAMGRLLGADDRARYERMGDIVYALHPDLTLGYANAAWFRNWPDAAFHGRWGLGADVSVAWPAMLRGPLELLLRDLARGTASGPPVRLDYACPTPELHRRFTMWVHPLGEALLVVNAQVMAQAASVGQQPDLQRYTGSDGLVRQCLNCRRTRDPLRQHWDWVPAWVRDLPDHITSDLCDLCERAYLRRVQLLGTMRTA